MDDADFSTVDREEPPPPLSSHERLTHLIYALQALGFLIGLTWIVAVVMNYVRKDDVAGTWLESHFRWQIRSFWFGLLWFVLGIFTKIIGIGFIVLAVNYIWLIYRVVKGWIMLNERKQLYATQD